MRCGASSYGTTRGTANVQLVTESTQTPEQLHARVLRDGDSYMVLMFVSAR